jgi:pyruvate formate lyase activating enzyme
MNAAISRSGAWPRHAEMEARLLKVGGLTPFSATDLPGSLSAVVFVQGCPWRCRYCHNPHLQARTAASPIDWADVLALLERRVGLVDAVVFSGGEPTMDPALESAIAQVRQLGFRIGMHTACIYPQRLAQVLPLLDWIGFDVKAPFGNYDKITRVTDSGAQVRACTELIVASGIAHDCRTTIHPSLLAEHEILELARTLSGIGVRNYSLQQFRATGCSDRALNAVASKAYPSAATVSKLARLFPQFTLRAA